MNGKSYYHSYIARDISSLDITLLKRKRILSDAYLSILLDSNFLSICCTKEYNEKERKWEAYSEIYFEYELCYSFSVRVYNRLRSFINSLEIGEEDNDN